MWIMSDGGLGFSSDGGKTISNIALTADGTISGTALAIGSVSQDAVDGLSAALTFINGELNSKISNDTAESMISQSAAGIRTEISSFGTELKKVTTSYTVGDDGIVIGKSDSPISLLLANNALQFLRDNIAEMEITSEGVIAKRLTTSTIVIGKVLIQADDDKDVDYVRRWPGLFF